MLDKIAGVLRELGIVAGIVYGLDRLVSKAGLPVNLRFYDLVAQAVADDFVLPARRRAAFEIREIGRDDPALALIPATPEVLAFRFNQPAVCLGAWSKGQLVGYLWLCLGPYEEDEVRCRFVPVPETEAVWDFDVYIFPEHRIGFGFAALWEGAHAYLRGRGVRFTLSRIARTNVDSQRAHRHFGLKRLGRTLFITGNRAQIMLATVPPYVHVAVRPERRPVIRLHAPRT